MLSANPVELEEAGNLLDLFEKVEHCRTSYDIFRILKIATLHSGYQRFIAFHMPAAVDESLEKLTIVTNWNAELMRAFDGLALLHSSSFLKRLQDTVLPVSWTLDDFRENPFDVKNTIPLFRNFDLYSGMHFPFGDLQGNRGAIGLSGKRPAPDKTDVAHLNYLLCHIFDRLLGLIRKSEEPKSSLTNREIECLRWAAAGKTSSETGVILEITENTVNHYISLAIAKLHAVNKAQAVATAIRMSII